MENTKPTNKVVLHGRLEPGLAFSHETKGTRFVSGLLRVSRLSGTDDVLPVLFRERDAEGLSAGDEITLEGSLRSYNNKSGVGRKLVLNVLADDWVRESGEDRNEAELELILCRDPVVRTTPLCRTICDMVCAVPRVPGGHGRDYVPVIAWGSLAGIAGDMGKGDRLRASGRFQSRGYQKRQEDGSVKDMVAYEVSVMHFLGDDPGLPT